MWAEKKVCRNWWKICWPEKTIVCRHKSQKKKVCWKCEQKKKFVEIAEKYVDQKKHQMVT